MRHRTPIWALVALSLALVSGCSGDDTSDATTTTGSSAASASSAAPDLAGAITVSAASSLTEAFGQIADGFSAVHPDVDVTLTFDSSSALATQIVEGAPADVFAAADEKAMSTLTDEGRIEGEPQVFAGNELAIITKPGNPEGITSVADLADAGVVSLCGEDVPCGRYAQQVLDQAEVTLDEGQITRGQNAAATLTAVAEGDAVAGIVYVTDARAAGDAIDTVPIPAEQNVVASYPIGVVQGAGDDAVAAAFVEYVLGPQGQAVLRDLGFLPPP